MSDSMIRRRDFIVRGGAALAGVTLASRLATAQETPGTKLFSAMGTSGSIDKAAEFKALGAEFLTESTGGLLVPDKPEDVFERNLERIKASVLPVLACNGFIRPANLRCVGPEANHQDIAKWAEPAFRRLKRAGGKFIVFGSGGARRIPDGWPREKAEEQFVALLKLLGPLAETHGVIVAVEQLRADETNFINRIGEGARLIRAAGHPNVRLLADLYHMAVMEDTPADLKAAMDVVVHVEIAEKEGRTAPGVKGDDFRPYFKALKESGYQGAISIEGKLTNDQLPAAFKEIAKQAGEV